MTRYKNLRCEKCRPKEFGYLHPPPDSGDFVDQHIDRCHACNVGGDLLCCATCNLAFHMDCVQPVLLIEPDDDWTCAYCIADDNEAWHSERMNARKACRELDGMSDKSLKAVTSDGIPMFDEEGNQYSDYEIQRLRSIRKNEQRLLQLGLPIFEQQPKTIPKKTSQKKGSTNTFKPRGPMKRGGTACDRCRKRKRRCTHSCIFLCNEFCAYVLYGFQTKPRRSSSSIFSSLSSPPFFVFFTSPLLHLL